MNDIVTIILISPFLHSPLFVPPHPIPPPKYECFLRLISWLFISLSFCHFSWRFIYILCLIFKCEITPESIPTSLIYFQAPISALPTTHWAFPLIFHWPRSPSVL